MPPLLPRKPLKNLEKQGFLDGQKVKSLKNKGFSQCLEELQCLL
jgi:hypothetical protein